MKAFKPFGKLFQLRWREALGRPECPYLYRWMLVLFGYSIRLHHWIKSDDRRFFHDHSCDVISVVLRGTYDNVTPAGTFKARAFRPRFMKATDRHYLDIPKAGAWTLILCGRKKHKWGFWVTRKKDGVEVKYRPLRYFSKYGIIQDQDYQ